MYLVTFSSCKCIQKFDFIWTHGIPAKLIIFARSFLTVHEQTIQLSSMEFYEWCFYYYLTITHKLPITINWLSIIQCLGQNRQFLPVYVYTGCSNENALFSFRAHVPYLHRTKFFKKGFVRCEWGMWARNGSEAFLLEHPVCSNYDCSRQVLLSELNYNDTM